MKKNQKNNTEKKVSVETEKNVIDSNNIETSKNTNDVENNTNVINTNVLNIFNTLKNQNKDLKIVTRQKNESSVKLTKQQILTKIESLKKSEETTNQRHIRNITNEIMTEKQNFDIEKYFNEKLQKRLISETKSSFLEYIKICVTKLDLLFNNDLIDKNEFNTLKTQIEISKKDNNFDNLYLLYEKIESI